MSAVIVKGGRVLIKRANLSRGGRHLYNRGHHAEARAINRKIDCSGATIYIARLNIKDHPATMSRPCPECMEAILKSGIKKIVYINWDGEVVEERRRNFI
jgi:deoxycytidylate deaminase